MKYFDEAKRKNIFLMLLNHLAGVDRTMLALICDAYEELEKGRSGDSNATEIVLRLNSNISPIKIAVLPLVKNKEEITSKAKQVFNLLSPCFVSEYDETGTIGKRYRRQDEIGTPFCVTIDFDTLNDNALTVRNRE